MKDKEKQLDKFFDAWQRLDCLYDDFARKNGLSDTEMVLLSYIYMNQNEACTQKYLCEKTLLPKQTVNSVISSFVKKELAVLKEIPGDRRNKQIVLTETGRTLCRTANSSVRKAEIIAVTKLGDEQWNALVDTLDRYSTIFREEMKKL